MQQLLLEARNLAAHWHGTTGGPVPEAVRAETAAAWDVLLKPVLEHYESLPPPTRGRGRRRGHNLAQALRQEREAYLRFLADPAVPFTHNRAERALCITKVHIKIAGCFRTRDGAERFALLRGLVETARQWPARLPAAGPGGRGAAARPTLIRHRQSSGPRTDQTGST